MVQNNKQFLFLKQDTNGFRYVNVIVFVFFRELPVV